MQLDGAIPCQIHACWSQKSLHPVLGLRWFAVSHAPSCHGCPQKSGRQEQWHGWLEGSCPGFLQQMSAKNGLQEQWHGLQEGSCPGFLQQMSAKNGLQEQWHGLQEGSCPGFLQQMSAKNGPQEPSPRLGF